MGRRKFRSLGLYAIDWIEHFLVHGPGDVQGKRIELDDELANFTLDAYELDARGNRKIRRAFLSRAKGRNKSGFAAMLECFEALGECRFDHWAQPGEVSDSGYEFEAGEPVGKPLVYAEIINVATEEGQAGNTYDAVYYMLHPDTCSLELLERYGRLDVGLTRINLPDRRGFIEPVSASNESNDGAKSTFIVSDETHLWIPPVTGAFKLGKMHQTMLRNLLKRKESSGWMLETSTMYAEGERSVAEGTHAYARSASAATLLFDHRQASEHWDLGKRSERLEALREAYGPAASWMNLSAIADYWDDPQATEAEFRRFWLNQPVPLHNPVAIDVVRWTTPVSEGGLENRNAAPPTRVVLVINVSPHRSAASIAVAGAAAAEGKTLVVVFSGDGTGWVAHMVADLIVARDIAEVALTPGEARGLESELMRESIEVKKLTGTDVAASCSAFLAAINDGTVEHGGQPELDRAVAEARLRRMGASETWDIDQKVDISPLVAAAAAFHRWGLLPVDLPYDLLGSVL
jgi:hypothetical protein